MRRAGWGGRGWGRQRVYLRKLLFFGIGPAGAIEDVGDDAALVGPCLLCHVALDEAQLARDLARVEGAVEGVDDQSARHRDDAPNERDEEVADVRVNAGAARPEALAGAEGVARLLPIFLEVDRKQLPDDDEPLGGAEEDKHEELHGQEQNGHDADAEWDREDAVAWERLEQLAEIFNLPRRGMAGARGP